MKNLNRNLMADICEFCLCFAFIMLFSYLSMVGCTTIYADAVTRMEAEYSLPEAPHIIVLEAPEAKREHSVEVVEPIVEEVVEEEVTLYYDIPLSEDLQDHIFAVCEEYGVDPDIVVSMIRRESGYRADAVGDSGRSLGLMQIQPRWHSERMAKLGCDNLLDPYQNVTVGIDLLAELIEQRGSTEWALMAYNGGPSYANKLTAAGKVSEYAREIIAMAGELERS